MEGIEIYSEIRRFDDRGVRIFPVYQSMVGTWGLELYRKKTLEESEGDHDWKMIRVGHIQSYESRDESELAGIKKAEDICEEFGFPPVVYDLEEAKEFFENNSSETEGEFVWHSCLCTIKSDGKYARKQFECKTLEQAKFVFYEKN